MNPTSYYERMERKLRDAFQPILLNLMDDSARHAGHAGHHKAGETHFKLHLVSAVFEDLSPLARHRRVYDVLKDELSEHVHALEMTLKSAKEFTKKED